MPSILFICTANRFRSVLAEAIFKEKLSRLKDNLKWCVESAGTWTLNGLTPMIEAQDEAEKRGLDVSKHRSQQVSEKLLARFDLIIVMEINHKEALIIEFPELSDRINLLSEVGGGIPLSILDPYSENVSPTQVANEIDQLINEKFLIIYQYLTATHENQSDLFSVKNEK